MDKVGIIVGCCVSVGATVTAGVSVLVGKISLVDKTGVNLSGVAIMLVPGAQLVITLIASANKIMVFCIFIVFSQDCYVAALLLAAITCISPKSDTYDLCPCFISGKGTSVIEQVLDAEEKRQKQAKAHYSERNAKDGEKIFSL